MARENPTWGAPHIQHEPRFLECDIAISTVARYMRRGRHPGKTGEMPAPCAQKHSSANAPTCKAADSIPGDVATAARSGECQYSCAQLMRRVFAIDVLAALLD